MTCGHCGTEKKKAVYECRSCGRVSNRQEECCGMPMKKKKK